MFFRNIKMVFLLFLTFFICSSLSYAGEQTVSHIFSRAVEWSLGEKEEPTTYWSPYICIGSMGPPLAVCPAGLRLKLGLRCSLSSIILKDDLKMDFTYDPDQAKAGKILKIKIKPQFLDTTDYNTFYSLIGAAFPNELQLGLLGVDIPFVGNYDLLPWWTLPFDLWQILSWVGGTLKEQTRKVNIGQLVQLATENLSVEMQSKDALPLGSTKEYADPRTLFEISLSDVISKEKKTWLMTKIWNAIPSSTKTTAINILKWLPKANFTEATATEFLCDKIISAIGGIAGLASAGLKANPSYKVTGESLVILVKYWVPGKTSGNYPITFNGSNIQNGFELPIRIPLFIEDNDKLFLAVESITYKFKIEQTLDFKIKISMFERDLVNTSKVMGTPQTSKTIGEDVFKLEVPLAKSDEVILNYNVKTGSDSATVWWASPNVMLKGTVEVYKGNTLVAQKTEANFTNSHQVIFSGLQPNTEYTFKTTCQDTQGKSYPEFTTTAKTLASPPPQTFETKTYISLPYENYNLEYPQGTPCTSLSMSTPQVTATSDSLTFSWTTNVPASTEVFIGVSPDYSSNYVGYVKKANGNIDYGYYGSSGGASGRELVTNHQITVSGLAADTTYYFTVRSWTFTTNYYKSVKVSDGFFSDQYAQKTMTVISTDDIANCYYALGYMGSVKTQALPQPEAFVIAVRDASNNPLANVLVSIRRADEASYQLFSTDNQGLTPWIPLHRAKTYIASVTDHPVFQDKQIQFEFPQTGPLQTTQTMQLIRKPSAGGYVYDTNGQGISGANVKLFSGTNQIRTTTTDNNGHYTFEGLNPGNYCIEVSKAGYVSQSQDATVDALGFFSASGVTLNYAPAQLNLQIKINNQPAQNLVVSVTEQYTGQTWNLNTDVQGEASLSINFESLQQRSFLVIVPASETLKINEKRVGPISLAPAQVVNQQINCPVDNQLQASVEGIYVSRDTVGNLCIDIHVNKQEPVDVQMVYQDPSGKQEETAYRPYSSVGSLIFSINNPNPGTYRIKAKIKDTAGNTSETDFTDFTVFKNESLSLSISDITHNSAKV
ncbi:MAG: carboxypeptidase regulatory-like domain-containing protein, partial [Candidatus Omnitrophica bacterium]|nr:carboxypeptidase regulatory-like domain-containing protein [Candidatus Omnitrophota bacterium]